MYYRQRLQLWTSCELDFSPKTLLTENNEENKSFGTKISHGWSWKMGNLGMHRLGVRTRCDLESNARQRFVKCPFDHGQNR